MDLSAITMDRNAAREAFLAYRRAVRERHNAEDEQIMRGYRAMARGHQVINIRETFEKAGTKSFEHVYSRWDAGLGKHVRARKTTNLPALAIMRADQQECYLATQTDGRVWFHHRGHPQGHETRNLIRIGTNFSDLEWTRYEWRAMVPIVPPGLRPKDNIGNYHVLWEAEWEKHAPPRPPGDPALLKYIGGELYAVLAMWDLTPLERAVLAGRS